MNAAIKTSIRKSMILLASASALVACSKLAWETTFSAEYAYATHGTVSAVGINESSFLSLQLHVLVSFMYSNAVSIPDFLIRKIVSFGKLKQSLEADCEIVVWHKSKKLQKLYLQATQKALDIFLSRACDKYYLLWRYRIKQCIGLLPHFSAGFILWLCVS